MTRFNPYLLPTLTYMVASRLGGVEEGRVDSATSTTMTDARLSVYPDDHFNNGVIWILDDDSGGTGGGTVNVVDDFTQTGGVVTIGEEVYNPVPTSSSFYAICTARYSLYELRAAVNRAIESLGKIVYVRTADYTTAGAQTEYTLVEQTDAGDVPVVIDADAEVLQVEIQTETGDANDNRWRPLDIGWRVQKGDPGSMGVLVLDQQPPTGYALRVTMRGQHPFLNPLGVRQWTELDGSVPYQLVVLEACNIMLQQREGENFVLPRLNAQRQEIKESLQRVQETMQPYKPAPAPKLFAIPNRKGRQYRELYEDE